jgi:hypothetical protein
MTRRKPTPPRDVAGASESAAELLRASREEAARIKAYGGTVNIDPRTGLMVGARRMDCFTALLTDLPAEASAVKWFEDIMRTASGENTQERRPDFIRASCEGAPGQNVSDAMIEASRYCEVITDALRPWEAKMLLKLLDADASLLTRWRFVVLEVTGNRNPVAQGQALKSACSSLVWVRDNIERLMRERRDRRAAA